MICVPLPDGRYVMRILSWELRHFTKDGSPYYSVKGQVEGGDNDGQELTATAYADPECLFDQLAQNKPAALTDFLAAVRVRTLSEETNGGGRRFTSVDFVNQAIGGLSPSLQRLRATNNPWPGPDPQIPITVVKREEPAFTVEVRVMRFKDQFKAARFADRLIDAIQGVKGFKHRVAIARVNKEH